MKRWNGYPMRDKAVLPFREPGRDPRVGRCEKLVTMYVKTLIAQTDQRCKEVSGDAKPDIIAREMLAMLHITGERTFKGLAKDLHISHGVAKTVIEHLKKENLVETRHNKRKLLCVVRV